MTESAYEPITPGDQLSTKQIVMKSLKWVGLGFLFLIVFTVIKIPNRRIINLIQGNINSILSSNGISLSSSESSFSLLGLKYKMKGAKLQFPTSREALLFDEISVSPSLFAFFLKKISGSAYLRQGRGDMDLSFSFPMGKPDGNIQVDLDIDSIDLAKGRILETLIAYLGGGASFPLTSGTLSGSGSISGSLSKPDGISGYLDLGIKGAQSEETFVQGFKIPALKISSLVAKAGIDSGKVRLKDVQIGNADGSDDLTASLKGDLTLANPMPNSRLSMEIKFKLSPKVQGAFSILEGFISNAKQADGYYGFCLTGNMSFPQMSPMQGGNCPRSP